jgi:hypothetical protein
MSSDGRRPAAYRDFNKGKPVKGSVSAISIRGRRVTICALAGQAAANADAAKAAMKSLRLMRRSPLGHFATLVNFGHARGPRPIENHGRQRKENAISHLSSPC